jgi:hypothetical protein
VPFHLSGPVRVAAIREHSRTIRGRKDPATGSATLENINLGWFLHLEFEGGIYAFRYGPEIPRGISEGDIVTVTLSKD